jgi:hypothetical protein
MCDSGSLLKNVLREAGNPDKILCYVGVMEANGAFSASYDGTDKFYSITGAGESGGAMKVKFNISTGSDGVISNFKMWTCESGSTQSEYISVTNTNGVVAMRSIHSNTRGGFSFASIATASGNFSNTTGWSTKNLAVSYSGSGTGFTDNGYTTITQGATTATISGFHQGTYSSNPYISASYAVVDLIGTSSLNTFAVGNGSVKFDAAFNSSSLPGTPTTISWNGDTQALVSPASNGENYTAANSGTLPTPSTQNPTFAGAEIWDCTSSSGFTSATIEGNTSIQSGLSTCDTQFAADDHQGHIDCHSGS